MQRIYRPIALQVSMYKVKVTIRPGTYYVSSTIYAMENWKILSFLDFILGRLIHINVSLLLTGQYGQGHYQVMIF